MMKKKKFLYWTVSISAHPKIDIILGLPIFVFYLDCTYMKYYNNQMKVNFTSLNAMKLLKNYM